MVTDKLKEQAVVLLADLFARESNWRERLMRDMAWLEAESLTNFTIDKIINDVAEMYYNGVPGFQIMTHKDFADYLVTEYADYYEGDTDRDDITFTAFGLIAFILDQVCGE